MQALHARGLVEPLREWLRADRPFFGICIGYQVLFDSSEEEPGVAGLGVFAGKVIKFPAIPGLKIPHMGWNVLTDLRPHPVLNGLKPEPHVYFVHSYALNTEHRDHVAARCDYGGKFVAAVARDNLFGTQFHPEKSQQAGQTILANFLRWKP